MPIKVSVIIPIFNIEEYLKECLDSLVRQTLKEIQVILVDDGSTDSSGMIADDYASRYHNFEVYHIKNSGPAAARNYGIDKANGEYLGFVDSDDWIEPEMYEKMYNAAKQNNDCDIVLTRVVSGESNRDDAYLTMRSGYYNREQIEKDILPFLLPGITDQGTFRSLRWSTLLRLFRREVVVNKSIRYFEKSPRAEDLVFTFLCTVYSHSYYYLDDYEMYHNRPREKSVSTGYLKNMWPAVRAVAEYFREFSKVYDRFDFSQKAQETAFYFSVSAILNENLLTDKKMAKDNMLKVMNDEVCVTSLSYIDRSKLNEKYSRFYQYIFEKDANGFIKYLKRRKMKSNMIQKLSGNHVCSGIIRKLKGKKI